MSANVGGYIRGPWWRYQNEPEEKTRRYFVIAWGNIVNDPKETFKDLRRVRFAIKTGRGAGRSEKHLVCTAFGERIPTMVMRALERGDVVLVCGTWVETQSKTKKGVKPTYECRVNFILPLELVGFLMNLNALPELQQMIENRMDEEADVWESD